MCASMSEMCTFSSIVPLARKRYTNTRFFCPSRHTLPAACHSIYSMLTQLPAVSSQHEPAELHSSLACQVVIKPRVHLAGKQLHICPYVTVTACTHALQLVYLKACLPDYLLFDGLG